MHVALAIAAASTRASVEMAPSKSPGASSDRPLPTDTYLSEYSKIFDHIGMLEARSRSQPISPTAADAIHRSRTWPQDMQRMAAYHDAIKRNAAVHFKGKVVLDVGSGTGVLAIWAAQAGARRVYAVEASGVGAHIQTMVEAHGLADTVTVLRERVEQVELAEQARRSPPPAPPRVRPPTSAARAHSVQVDVIVSEWMGYFLLRESMVESAAASPARGVARLGRRGLTVVRTRGRCSSRGTAGSSREESCTLRTRGCSSRPPRCPASCSAAARRLRARCTRGSSSPPSCGASTPSAWTRCRPRPAAPPLARPSAPPAPPAALAAALTARRPRRPPPSPPASQAAYEREHHEYAFSEAWQGILPASLLRDEPQVLLEADMHSVTHAQFFDWQTEVQFAPPHADEPQHGLCGWFDVRFCGSESQPAHECVELDTSPEAPPTHWAQTTLLLERPLDGSPLVVALAQNSGFHHDLNVTVSSGAWSASYAVTADFRGGEDFLEDAEAEEGEEGA